MRNIFILLFFITAFNLTGCSSKQEYFFEKKQECQKYIPEAQEKIASYGYKYLSHQLIELFYSPAKDSCIVFYSYEQAHISGGFNQIYNAYDVLSEENIFVEKVKNSPTETPSFILEKIESLKKDNS